MSMNGKAMFDSSPNQFLIYYYVYTLDASHSMSKEIEKVSLLVCKTDIFGIKKEIVRVEKSWRFAKWDELYADKIIEYINSRDNNDQIIDLQDIVIKCQFYYIENKGRISSGHDYNMMIDLVKSLRKVLELKNTK